MAEVPSKAPADPTIPDPDAGKVTVHDAVPASDATMRLPQPPPEIGGWRLGRKIGHGGMGAVHLAEKDGRQGALKVMHASLAGQGDFRTRFLREATVLATVRHPNVVQLLGHGEQDGWLWLVMDYVPGGDLSGFLKRRGTVLEKEACTIMARCARGLIAIHAAGLIHRDIKPENILLMPPKAGEMPEPKIGDLGMARHTEGEDRFTMTGTACGTPAYMAPEQIRGSGDLDARVDVYALGATLFTLLTGQRPFDGPTIYVLTHEVLTKPVPAMRRYNPLVSPGACALVEKAMSKDRASRHRDAGELLLDLERLAEGKQPLHSAALPSPASMVFQEVAGQAAPRRPASGAIGAGSFSGIPWGPLLRLALPVMVIIAVITAATWLLERKTRQREAQTTVAQAQAVGTAGGMDRDENGALVNLQVAGRTALLRWCPPGNFLMGSPAGEPGREESEELHPVQLSRGFWMLAGEVSNGLYASLMDGEADTDATLPATDLPLEACLTWIDRLNRLHPGLGARLPTEAEWEYACRAGSGMPFATSEPTRVCNVPEVLSAWRSGGIFAAEGAALLDQDNPLLRPRPVDGGPLNAWGIGGMHGNVAEWCADRWDGESPYGDQPRVDPIGQFGGGNAVRGGSWLHPLALCRSAARAVAEPGKGKPWLGFRFLVPGGASASWPPR
ncbi:MAG: protein kinase [Planctomycetes bacterium]|nr:protein kinase [Planctomycetota bacterium]